MIKERNNKGKDGGTVKFIDEEQEDRTLSVFIFCI